MSPHVSWYRIFSFGKTKSMLQFKWNVMLGTSTEADDMS